jgi:hypothetical protein
VESNSDVDGVPCGVNGLFSEQLQGIGRNRDPVGPSLTPEIQAYGNEMPLSLGLICEYKAAAELFGKKKEVKERSSTTALSASGPET